MRNIFSHMMHLRSLIAIGLAVILTISSSGMVQARDHAKSATGSFVICIGASTIVLRHDGNGDPVKPGHICPDCALSLFALPAKPIAARFQPVQYRPILVSRVVAPVLAPRSHRISAPRAPPQAG